MGDEEEWMPAVVVDIGVGWWKAGLSKMKAPSFVEYPCFVKTSSGTKRGKAALDYCKSNNLEPPSPLSRGSNAPFNWDVFTEMFYETFERLGVAPEEMPVLLVNNFQLPKAYKEKIVSILFEDFNIPCLYMATSQYFALYEQWPKPDPTVNKRFYLVLDCGEAQTSIAAFKVTTVPGHQHCSWSTAGQQMDQWTERPIGEILPYGGRHIREALWSSLLPLPISAAGHASSLDNKDNLLGNVELSTEQAWCKESDAGILSDISEKGSKSALIGDSIMEKVASVAKNYEADKQKYQNMPPPPYGKNYNAYKLEKAKELIDLLPFEIKQKVERYLKQNGQEFKHYVLPDSRILTIGQQAFECTEPLFSATPTTTTTTDTTPTTTPTIISMLRKVMDDCASAVEPPADSSTFTLLVIGGVSLLPGFQQRLAAEIHKELPDREISIVTPAEPQFAAWKGACAWNTSDHSFSWIEKILHDDSGPAIVHRYCCYS